MIVYLYITVIVVLTITICTIWIKKREFFPIKERSPIVLIIFCISNAIYLLAFPIIFLIQKYYPSFLEDHKD